LGQLRFLKASLARPSERPSAPPATPQKPQAFKERDGRR
jgi:hypothetical protein